MRVNGMYCYRDQEEEHRFIYHFILIVYIVMQKCQFGLSRFNHASCNICFIRPVHVLSKILNYL
jgi:hypothetical protein